MKTVALTRHQWKAINGFRPLLIALCHANKAGGSRSLVQSISRLSSISHQLVEQVPLEQIAIPIRRAMAQAIIVYQHLPSLCTDVVGGTIASPSLEQYQLAPLSADTHWQDILPSEELPSLSAFEEQVRATVSAIDLVLTAVRTRYNNLNTRDDVESLFQTLYGPLPIPVAALDCATTRSLISFAVAFKTNPLELTIGWEDLSIEERTAIADFLSGAGHSPWTRYANFPSYGLLEEDRIPAPLVSDIVKDTGIPEQMVRRILSGSVNVLPRHKVEYFLVHDTFGHGPDRIIPLVWDLFGQIESVLGDSSLKMSVSIGGRFRALEDWLRDPNTTTEEARQAFNYVATARLNAIITHIIAELNADVRESSSARAQEDPSVIPPSSSLVPERIARLDLEASDLVSAFRSIESVVQEIEQFVEQNRLSPSLASVIRDEYWHGYDPSGPFRPADVFSQALGNLVLLANGIERVVRKASSFPSIGMVASLFVACYCAEAPLERFFEVDDVLASGFLPCWSCLISPTK